MALRETLAATLKHLRLRSGMSQEALAERAGLSHRTIGDIECGVRRRPRRNTIDAIAAALPIADAQRKALQRAATQDGLTLPPPPRLIGRDREFSELSGAFTSPGTLVTITGPAGVGKTTLAIAVANHAVERFSGGVAFAALDAIDNNDAIAPAIAAALSIDKDASDDWMSAVCERLNKEPTLLVLDNVEHLEGTAIVTRQLMDLVQDLTVLATGRANLNVSYEREYHLAPLELPAAVELFLERAATWVPGYAVHDGDERFVRRLCSKLDRLPLAIELAAMRVRSFSPQQLCDRLWELVEQGPGDFPERHRALDAAIGWSFDLLDMECRRCVHRFSAFAGGATAEAVIAVCQVSAPVIDTLVRQNMLIFEGAGPRPRLRMLAVVRQFALTRAASFGEASDAAHAHANYYSDLAESLSGHSARTMAALNECYEVDGENFRRAVRYALETGAWEIAARTALALRHLWVRRGEFAEALTVFRAILSGTVGLPDKRLRWQVLDVASYFLSVAGETDAALACQSEECELAQVLADPEITMLSLLRDAAMHHIRGDNAAAIDRCRRVLREYGEGENLQLLGLAHGNLGFTLVEIGEVESALKHIELAERYYRAISDDHYLLTALQNAAHAFIYFGRLSEADVKLAEAMDLSRAIRSPYNLAMAYVNVAYIAVLSHDFERANEYLRNAVEFWGEARFDTRLSECFHVCALYFDSAACPREAAMLHAAEVKARKRAGYLGLRSVREEAESLEARLRSALGETAFEECTDLGRTMTPEDVLALLRMPQKKDTVR
jgi:predicted ATPase/transcriptional regulator with XRE-family HTH domain/tetratricopeptide (TPR) repeat protein